MQRAAPRRHGFLLSAPLLRERMSFFGQWRLSRSSPPTNTQRRRRGAFVRGTGNSAVFRLRSSRIGRNERARASGLSSSCRSCTYLYMRARVYFDRTERISFLARLWLRPCSFPAFDTPFRRRGLRAARKDLPIPTRMDHVRVLLTPESAAVSHVYTGESDELWHFLKKKKKWEKSNEKFCEE